MKTNVILIALYGTAKNVQTVCGCWSADVETNQHATYTVADGIATIHSLRPVLGTQVQLPFPFSVPINDLGSGQLYRVDINCDTLTPHVATCPTSQWANQRANRPPLTIQQQLIADYCSLL